MLPAIFTLLSSVAGGTSAINQTADAEGRATGFLTRTVKIDSTEYIYQVYVPANAANQKLPVVLFLHGIGQRAKAASCPSQAAAVRLPKVI
jgi:predicted peptidase